jgi:hypothetical protein
MNRSGAAHVELFDQVLNIEHAISSAHVE